MMDRIHTNRTARERMLDGVLVRFALAVTTVCAVAACKDRNPGSDEHPVEGDGGVPDASISDATTERDAAIERPDPGPDRGEDVGGAGDAAVDDDSGLERCRSNEDCDDGVWCNGQEVCDDDGTCETMDVPCSAEHPCMIEQGVDECDCSVPDHDNDQEKWTGCGGDDCDDGNPDAHPGAAEVCDDHGVDEDCVPETFHGATDGDRDDDGYISSGCFNIDSSGHRHGSEEGDCNDEEPEIYPHATELCDHQDNNCNGLFDELEVNGQMKNFGQFEVFYPDLDGDGWPNLEGKSIRDCPHPAPKNRAPATRPHDCDDLDPKINESALELCDGVDNDCDHYIDAEDADLLETRELTDTVLACVDARWRIQECPDDRLWCDESTTARGCETDATRLSSCHACETDCRFACGGYSCDEVAQLALGTYHSCARTHAGRVACWGRGREGRLGTDSMANVRIPSPSVLRTGAHELAAGRAHTCAIVGPNRVVYCWGSDESGQLGNLDVLDSSAVPVEVAGEDTLELRGVQQLSLGDEHSCAVTVDHEVLCWGSTADGRLGEGTLDVGQSGAVYVRREDFLDPPGIPVFVDVDDASMVAAGGRHSCLLTIEGGVQCWGDNSYGQLGNDSSVSQSQYAEPVSALAGAAQIAVGVDHSCAIVDGSVWCWGANDVGQLGRDVTEDNDVPGPVAGLGDVLEIALGPHFSCARTGGGEVYCWGDNSAGQLGDAQVIFSREPIRMPLSDVSHIAAGNHVCALTTDDQVLCWGSNAFGQLGTGTATEGEQVTPLPIAPIDDSSP